MSANNSPKDILWLQDLAKAQGGECLSTEYTTTQARYTFKCSNPNHKPWTTKANHIQQGHWCPACRYRSSGLLRRKGLPYLNELARVHGGTCLSNSYVNMNTSYEWKCKVPKHHSWSAYACNVYKGHWCPACMRMTSNKEQAIYAFVLSIYPDTLSGKRKFLKEKRFQLDVYVPSLKKAIEFDGTWCHHSEWADKHKIPQRDARKDLQCQDAAIDLLRITEKQYDEDPVTTLASIRSFLAAPAAP